MTDPNLTHIVVVLDRSGSMASIDSDATGGFNAFVEQQKKASGEAKLTLVRFDTEYEVTYRNMSIRDVPELRTVEPRGGTALRDAMARAIGEKGAELAALPEHQRPGKVVFVIITDGLENASREYSADQVKSKVEHQQQKYNWQFTYLGANQDAVLVGRSLGISADTSASFAAGNVRFAFCAASNMVASYRSAAGGSCLRGYDADIRAQLVDDPAKPQVTTA